VRIKPAQKANHGLFRINDCGLAEVRGQKLEVRGQVAF